MRFNRVWRLPTAAPRIWASLYAAPVYARDYAYIPGGRTDAWTADLMPYNYRTYMSGQPLPPSIYRWDLRWILPEHYKQITKVAL